MNVICFWVGLWVRMLIELVIVWICRVSIGSMLISMNSVVRVLV